MKQYTIGAVAQLTGLSQDTIRAWERRYQAVTPDRTDTKRRVYGEGQVKRLRLLKAAVDAGHSIGVAAGMTDDELGELTAVDASATATGDATFAIETLLSAVDKFDSDLCERTVGACLATGPLDLSLGEILIPALRETGDRWHRGEVSIAQERMISSCVRRLLSARLQAMRATDSAPVVIAGTLPGETHELGALMAATVAAQHACRVEYVGTALPAAEYVRLAKALDARVVALSFINDPSDPASRTELATLEKELPSPAQLWIGGTAGKKLADQLGSTGARHFADIFEFEVALKDLLAVEG